jgi:hypothetical protein
MEHPNDIAQRLLNIQKESLSKERRESLIDSMESNETNGHDCLSCEGTCCTFQANSMKVTPLETLDLVADMINKGRWTDEWEKKLREQVRIDRLGDNAPTDGKRDLIRRTYTCPFFKIEKGFGCGVEREKKPYGCLAFNPNTAQQTEGGDCSSDISSLEKQDEAFASIHAHFAAQLEKEFSISPIKSDLPSALLKFFDALKKQS